MITTDAASPHYKHMLMVLCFNPLLTANKGLKQKSNN